MERRSARLIVLAVGCALTPFGHAPASAGQAPRGDDRSFVAVVSESRARLAALSTSAVDLESAGPLVLPLVTAEGRVEADGKDLLLSLTGADGRFYVAVDGTTARPLALKAGREPAWVCRVPSPADGLAEDHSLRLLLEFRLAPPAPAGRETPWIARDVRVVGVRQRGGTSRIVFEASLESCRESRPRRFRGSPLMGWSSLGGSAAAREPEQVTELPRVLHQAPPRYTLDAMRHRIRGKVMLDCVVAVTGAVNDCELVQSLDPVYGLDAEALKAVRQWRFAPGRINGQPVPVLMTAEMAFILK